MAARVGRSRAEVAAAWRRVAGGVGTALQSRGRRLLGARACWLDGAGSRGGPDGRTSAKRELARELLAVRSCDCIPAKDGLGKSGSDGGRKSEADNNVLKMHSDSSGLKNSWIEG